jgi:hypothetical protein
MSHAQSLVRTLNELAKSPQFSYSKARAAARKDPNVDTARSKAHNADFNPDVDGCESFVMSDGSICEWISSSNRYAARGAAS